MKNEIPSSQADVDPDDKSFNIWIGLRASDYQIFTDLVNIDQIISIDIDNTRGIPLLSKEAISKRRETWSNDELLVLTDLSEVQELFSKIVRLKTPVHIYSYHSLPVLEELAETHKNIMIHSSPNRLRSRLDDKAEFIKILDTLNIPQILNTSNNIENMDFDDLVDTFGLPLVIKLKIGASGGTTYFVSRREDFLKLQKSLGNEFVIATQYISGPSLNINAFIGTKGIYLNPPSLQIIGIPECAPGKFTYCGNDFASFHHNHQHLTNEVYQLTQTIGLYMQSLGYYGVFGIDFIYDTKSKILYPLEINPRMQGSTALLTRYQLLNNDSRLVQLYRSETQPPFQSSETVEASFILLHNLGDKRLEIKNSFASGIYRFAFYQGQLQLTYLGDKKIFPGKNELLVLGCPQNGTVVEPGAGIMRLEFGDAILNKKGSHLKQTYSRIAIQMYTALWELSDVDIALDV